MTVKSLLQEASQALQESCERPQFEAELLLAHHLGRERTWLMIHDRDEVEDVEGFYTLVQRRANHEPYEYIVGEASFYYIHL
jgi:release factor glutamine methyltransferase